MKLGIMGILAVSAALGMCRVANAEDEAVVARLITMDSGETHTQRSGGILANHRKELGAIFEFDDLTCPFNEDGGMITKIVNQAMATVIAPDDFQVSFVTAGSHGHAKADVRKTASLKALDDQRETLLADILAKERRKLTFPWYRPNCSAPTFLTDHTRDLCDNHQWSEPLYEVLIGTFVRSDFGIQHTKHTDLYGRTICQSGEELPRMLHERGVSDLNARLIWGPSPKRCFDKLLSGEADAAIMPLLTGARLQREHSEFEEIQSAFKLDVKMTIHAISAADDKPSAKHIKALNLGIKNLRASGEWEEIVEEFFMGHSHETPYAKAQAHKH